MLIPKKIHYIWIGNEMPLLYKKCIDSWSKYHPDWEIICWNEKTFSGEIPFYFKKAINDRNFAFASDYLRCHILYNEGGIYIDADMECIKDFTPLLNSPFLGYEIENRISNGVMGFPPNHDFISHLIQYYDDNIGVYKAMPRVTTEIINNNNYSDIIIYDEDYFYPYNPYRKNSIPQLLYSDITSNTYAIHHWGKSWKISKLNSIKNSLKKLFR